MANITLIFKKRSKNKNENFRPVTILPVVSKNFEKIVSKQLSNLFENILSDFQCRFKRVIVRSIAYCKCLKNGNMNSITINFSEFT